MRVIPAIDLKDGRCVRLRQGDMAAETVYSEDVPSVAKRGQEQGAALIHIVELNGAVDGEPKNLPSFSTCRGRGRAAKKPLTVVKEVTGDARRADAKRLVD